MKDLSLFADVNLKEDDFLDNEAKFYFLISQKMSKGYKVLDEISLSGFLEQNPLLKTK